jgi:ribosomal RNA-processing protein 8
MNDKKGLKRKLADATANASPAPTANARAGRKKFWKKSQDDRKRESAQKIKEGSVAIITEVSDATHAPAVGKSTASSTTLSNQDKKRVKKERKKQKQLRQAQEELPPPPPQQQQQQRKQLSPPKPQPQALSGQQRQKKKRGGGSLLERMKQQLQGGQFRWLNERLYTTGSQEAAQMMEENPALYTQYHEGTALEWLWVMPHPCL